MHLFYMRLFDCACFFWLVITCVTELAPQWCYSTLYISKTMLLVHCLWLNSINHGVDSAFYYEARNYIIVVLVFFCQWLQYVTMRGKGFSLDLVLCAYTLLAQRTLSQENPFALCVNLYMRWSLFVWANDDLHTEMQVPSCRLEWLEPHYVQNSYVI
jgi:hypothetical protein